MAAALVMDGPGPLLKTEAGQRALQGVLSASAPALPAGVTVARRGEAVPPLTLPDLGGNPVAVPQAFAGRPLLINVWASWCGPCIQEMPELQRFFAEQGGKGVQVIGIALDDEAAVRRFLKTTPVAYPILIEAAGPADAGVRLGNPKGVLPYSVLVSADGRLLKQRIGPFEHGEISGWAEP
nr:TlpA disulfide reductase family protein [Luteimonas galliterrae]